MAITLIADAVSNLFRDIIEEKKLNVIIMNVRLRIDEKEYFVYDDIKNVHLFSKDYFEAMKDPKKKIQTTLVSTGEYYETFKKEVIKGNKVICFTMASGISGTYQSACIARDMINSEKQESLIEIIDCMTAGMGEGLQVIHAQELINEGKDFDEIVKELNEFKHYVRSDFTVDNIKYLLSTGRVLKTLGRFANFLDIKVLLKRSDHSNIAYAGHARGKKKAIAKLIETVVENINLDIEQTVYITHCDIIEEAEQIKAELESKGIKNIEIYDYDIISGAHIGPGSLAVFYVAKEAY